MAEAGRASPAGFRPGNAASCRGSSSPGSPIGRSDSGGGALDDNFLSWRQIFIACGSVGFFWAVGWYYWFRDEPGDHPSITPEERDMILRERNLPAHDKHDAGSFAAVFKHPSPWVLCLMYVANTYGFYFLITWLPTYLEKVRGFAKAELAVFAGLPLMLSVVADIFGGLTTDWLTKRFGHAGAVLGRLCGICDCRGHDGDCGRVGLGPNIRNLIAIAAAFSMFTLAPSWACCIDIGEHRSGVLARD